MLQNSMPITASSYLGGFSRMSSMTSQSGSVDNYSCGNSGNGNISSRRHHSDAGGTILKANTGFFGPTSIPITAPLLQTAVNQPIASVTIGTEDLNDPSALVQFLGTLTAAATTPAGLTFNFTLFRNCRHDGFREQLRSFTVSLVIPAAAVLGVADSRSLSFAYFQGETDCRGRDCCTYTLELTSVAATVTTTVNVTVNGTLSVLAAGEEE
jgi:hypothetical protein